MVVSLKSVVERPVIAQDTEHDFTHLPITRVVRGAMGMQEVVFAEGRKGRKVIHTTNMRENRITDVKRIQNGEQYTLQGTAVLIPRVCNPNKGKICIYNEKSFIRVVGLCNCFTNEK